MAQDPQTLVPVAQPSPEQIRAALDRVFEDPELRGAIAGPHGVDAGGYVQQFFEWLRGWTEWIDGLRVTSPWLYGLVLLALIGVLGLLVWHIAYTVRGALGHRAEGQPVSAAVGDRVRDHRQLRAEARRLAAAGELREAVRTLLFALLALLEERRVVHVARGWTTREILARLAQRIGRGAELVGFASVVEQATYGGGELDAGRFADLDTAVDGFAAAVGEAGRP